MKFTTDPELLSQYYSVREECYQRVENGPSNFCGAEDPQDRISDILVVKKKPMLLEELESLVAEGKTN